MAIKNIGIDIREASGKGGGKARYAKEITEALIRQASNLSFSLFTKKSHPFFMNKLGVQQILIPGKGPFWHLNLRRYLKHNPVDIFIAPTSYIYPAFSPKEQKLVTVVHDLIALRHGKEHHYFPRFVEGLTLKPAMRRSDLIVTVSKHTWRDLLDFMPEVQKKAQVVVGPAISEHIKPVTEFRMNLPKDFLLAVGTLAPRKNIQGVIKAFAKIAPYHSTLDLCIAGSAGWKTDIIFKSIPQDLKNRIHFLGYVHDHELLELYTRAKLLLFPSFYEGFGLPPLEAMACACPVITSNTSSLPEVVGEAALLIDPSSTEQMIEAIQSMLDPKISQIAKKRGLKHVQNFSWDKSAQVLLRAINQCFK